MRIECSSPTSLAVFALLAALASPALAQQADVTQLIDDLVAANRILYLKGVVDGFGHISVRHPTEPGRFLMAAALAPARVTKDDVMLFDFDGKPVDQRDRPIYSERFIHSEIYKAR